MRPGSLFEISVVISVEICVIFYNSKRSGKKKSIPNPCFELQAGNSQPLTLEHFCDLAHLQSTAPQSDSAVWLWHERRLLQQKLDISCIKNKSSLHQTRKQQTQLTTVYIHRGEMNIYEWLMQNPPSTFKAQPKWFFLSTKTSVCTANTRLALRLCARRAQGPEGPNHTSPMYPVCTWLQLTAECRWSEGGFQQCVCLFLHMLYCEDQNINLTWGHFAWSSKEDQRTVWGLRLG